MSDFFFALGICFLLVHEMDAVRCEEWRVFPVTSRMTDERGYLAFAALHLPLYAVLLLALLGDGPSRGLMPAWTRSSSSMSSSTWSSSTTRGTGSGPSSRTV